ncbi:T6SS phospholipase effector Tle1-like catalytic domain-containing protein [Lysobacter cavernae]|uniref:T6SS phospholipase effector Tle1-like catalytic domain-containing protein n=1 Tax=Lysobacter cavernae TaxID=1685901 RepID=A0ABV7RSK0_9GAMM
MPVRPGSPDHKGPPAPPDVRTLQRSADPEAGAAATTPAAMPEAVAAAKADVQCVGPVCRIPLWISIFFDGTGNNREADEPTHRDSNVARLYRAHVEDDSAEGIYRVYVPGIGTYFREIGDPGETNTGKAFAAYGDARLQWAMRQLDLVVAKYPANRVLDVNVALFGFSRGAALARAFALRLAKRVTRQSGKWTWDKAPVPFRLRFMGIFDTVASVGLPATADTLLSARIAKGWVSLEDGLRARGGDPASGPLTLAFGAPGADPTPGNPDGHSDWASDLHIPQLAERCVHLVAAHEQRNSFPLDSARNGRGYPGNCVEIVYPGMHSDVGGGYLPGFQGKSLDRREALSNIPLRAMHAEAVKGGVPLEPIGQFKNGELELDFQVTPDLIKSWKHYMTKAGNTARPLGHAVLAHMRLYFAWRFQRIRTYQYSEVPKAERLPNERDIRAGERAHQQQKAAANHEMQRLQNSPELRAAEDAMRRADQDYQAAMRNMARFGDPNGKLATAAKARDVAQQRLEEAKDPYLRAQARAAGIPGGSVDNLLVYDRQLVRDAEMLSRLVKGGANRAPLRPHYAALVQAYENEFIHDQGLRDAEIIAFFDNYVHDSLAGFAMDASLPSDPRAIYIGGDEEAQYARSGGDETGTLLAAGEVQESGEESAAA